jgi:four helix bundle protein
MANDHRVVSYRDLDAWRVSMDLVELVYDATEHFPRREHFGLAAQLRKSAVSIPSNVAEGHRRTTTAFLNHMGISLGSHAELETQVEIGRRRRYFRREHLDALRRICERVGQLLHGLESALERRVQQRGLRR